MRQLWRAPVGQEPVQQRARRHQARAHEVKGAAVAFRIQVYTRKLFRVVQL